MSEERQLLEKEWIETDQALVDAILDKPVSSASLQENNLLSKCQSSGLLTEHLIALHRWIQERHRSGRDGQNGSEQTATRLDIQQLEVLTIAQDAFLKTFKPPFNPNVIQVSPDGNQWMALLGRNLEEGFGGFGCTLPIALRGLADCLEKRLYNQS